LLSHHSQVPDCLITHGYLIVSSLTGTGLSRHSQVPFTGAILHYIWGHIGATWWILLHGLQICNLRRRCGLMSNYFDHLLLLLLLGRIAVLCT